MNILRTLANLFAYPDPWEASTRNQIAKDARQKGADQKHPHTPWREIRGWQDLGRWYARPASHLSADDFMDDPRPASLLTVNTTGHGEPNR